MSTMLFLDLKLTQYKLETSTMLFFLPLKTIQTKVLVTSIYHLRDLVQSILRATL
jgi:hypothetical protein